MAKTKEKKEKEEKERPPLKIMCSKGCWEILNLLAQKGKARYKDFRPFASTYALNEGLKELRKRGLIQHCFVKEERRKEWYELTEKGKKIVYWMGKAVDLMEGKEEDGIMDKNVISESR